MTNPNEKLGEWLLRDVLALKDKELVTIERLDEIGLDSVVIYKIDNENYEIDFTKTGSFEEFKENVLNSGDIIGAEEEQEETERDSEQEEVIE